MCTLNCCKLLAISYFLSIIVSLSSYLKHSKPILDFLYPTWHPGNGRLFAFASMWFSRWRLGLFIARLDCTSRFLEQKKKNWEIHTHCFNSFPPSVRFGASWCRKAAGTGNHGKKTRCSIAVIVDTLGHGDLTMKHI